MKKLILSILFIGFVFASIGQNINGYYVTGWSKLEAKRAFVIDLDTFYATTQLNGVDTILVSLNYVTQQLATKEPANANIQQHITNDADLIIGNEIQSLTRVADSLKLTSSSGVDLSDFAKDADLANYAPATGSTAYIQNGTSQQTADFNISGTGRVGNYMTMGGADIDYFFPTEFLLKGSTSSDITFKTNTTSVNMYSNTSYPFYLYDRTNNRNLMVFNSWSNSDVNFYGNITAPSIKLTTGAINGYIATSDADGDVTWQSPLNAIGGNYIQNQNSSAQTANMWISGRGRFGSSAFISGDLDNMYLSRNWYYDGSSKSLSTNAQLLSLDVEGLKFFADEGLTPNIAYPVTERFRISPIGNVTAQTFNVKNSGTSIDSDGSSLYLKANGNTYLNTAANSYVTSSGGVVGTTFQSTVATGTAPFTAASSTLNTNLNADLLNYAQHKQGYFANGVTTDGTYNSPIGNDGYGSIFRFRYSTDNSYYTDLYAGANDAFMYYRKVVNGSSTVWRKIWDDTNLPNPIQGTGSANYIPKWGVGGTSLTGTSQIYDNGTNVGIGTTNPFYNLDVKTPDVAYLRLSGDDYSDYINAGIILQNNGSQSYRGLGIFYYDVLGQHEWYSGSPYADADSYIIGRRGGATSHSSTTAQNSNAFLSIKNNGNVRFHSIGTGTMSSLLGVTSDGTLTTARPSRLIFQSGESSTPGQNRSLGFAYNNSVEYWWYRMDGSAELFLDYFNGTSNNWLVKYDLYAPSVVFNGNINFVPGAKLQYNGEDVFISPLTSGSAGALGTILVGNGTTSAPLWSTLNKALSGADDGLDANYIPYWDGSKLVDGLYLINNYTLKFKPAYFSSYTTDGVFDANAIPSFITTTAGGPDRNIIAGYRDFGGGNYYPRLGFKASTVSSWSLGQGNLAGDFSIGIGNNNNESGDFFRIKTTGEVTLTNLAGTGTRLVTASSTGQLGNIANTAGYLYNDGSGNYSYSTPASQTITLSGDVSGSGTTSITTTVADNSHNHNSTTAPGTYSSLASLGGLGTTGSNIYLSSINAAGGSPLLAEYVHVLPSSGTTVKAVTLSSLFSIIPDATTTTKGIASFNSSNFTVSSGAVSITNSGHSHNAATAPGTYTALVTNGGLGASGSSLYLSNTNASGTAPLLTDYMWASPSASTTVKAFTLQTLKTLIGDSGGWTDAGTLIYPITSTDKVITGGSTQISGLEGASFTNRGNTVTEFGMYLGQLGSVSTPPSGYGIIWSDNDGTDKLFYTNDGGTQFDLTGLTQKAAVSASEPTTLTNNSYTIVLNTGVSNLRFPTSQLEGKIFIIVNRTTSNINLRSNDGSTGVGYTQINSTTTLTYAPAQTSITLQYISGGWYRIQ